MTTGWELSSPKVIPPESPGPITPIYGANTTQIHFGTPPSHMVSGVAPPGQGEVFTWSPLSWVVGSVGLSVRPQPYIMPLELGVTLRSSFDAGGVTAGKMFQLSFSWSGDSNRNGNALLAHLLAYRYMLQLCHKT